MKPTRGCSSGGTEGEGPHGLLGFLISIAFAFLFVSIFLPVSAERWFLLLFIDVEIGAAVFYIVSERRSRTQAGMLKRKLHQINERPNH